MEFEDKIKSKLLMRGFTQKQLLNNRGLIGATIDETILLQTKNFAIPVSCEQLKTKEAHFCYCMGTDNTSSNDCSICGGKKMR